MSLLWTSVSALLCLELVILLALCAPLPWGFRKNVSRWIFRVKLQQGLDAAFKYIIFALILALAESLNSLKNIHVRREFKQTDGQRSDSGLQIAALHDVKWQKARAERNLYLASFAITAMIAIARLIRLVSIEVQLRQKIKQYNGGKPISETGDTIDAKQD